MRKLFYRILGLVTLFVCQFSVYAAPIFPADGALPTCGGPWTCIPIDGGVGLLIAAGALIGGRKLLNKKS